VTLLVLTRGFVVALPFAWLRLTFISFCANTFMLEMGEPDMTAEFMGLFRQYGCTERNDLQLRGGTHYLLKLLHNAGIPWIACREPNEALNRSDYNKVHRAWTGMSGVRVRVAQPAVSSSYGRIVRA
jgi:hypothetical protein